MRLGEFELINLLTKKLKRKNRVKVGIGDDTAVFKLNNKYKLGLLTCDSLVENTHFLKEWEKIIPNFFYYLGRKLVSVSVSDIASMGGFPLYSLITLGISKQLKTKDLEELYCGINSALEDYNFSLVGGDTVRSSNFFLDFSVFGVSKGTVMLRSKAQPGDLIGVTGTLGDSRAGLEQLLKGSPENNYLVKRFLDPKARLKEGINALKLGVLCSTDVSDGFVFNLYTIAEASNVKIEIETSEIPISKELKEFAGKNALNYALYGGEDYELIISYPENIKNEIEALGFKTVGKVFKGKGVFLNGKLLKKRGYDHLKGGTY